MRPIKLCQLFKSGYDDKIACAFIFYANAQQIYDHEDHEVGIFMPSNDHFAYDEFMRTNIVPIIQKGLKNTAYQPAFIDHYNQSPQPFLAITRRDNQPLTDHDLIEIERNLHDILAAHNKKSMPAKLFSKSMQHDALAMARTGQHEHGYQTRSKIK